jgi:nucleoside-diphosphate-sugar epimerase
VATFLITGGAGFIGSHLATALVERGDRVHVLDDLSSGKLANLAHLDVGEPGSGATVELFEGDLRDRGLARAACRGTRGIFHEAAQVSVPRSLEDPEESYAVNVMGTLGLLEAARAEGVKGVVLAASSAAYGDTEVLPKVETMTPQPLSPYASGKLAAEALLAVWGRAFGLHTVSLRYFNVFGPRQADDSPYTGVIALFARALLDENPVAIHGDGEQTRDFTYVSDAVQANLLAMDADLPPGEVINVGAGERVSINELYRELATLAGREFAPEYLPPRAGDVRHSLAALDKARSLLGYEPRVPWREGIRMTLDWYRGRDQAGR